MQNIHENIFNTNFSNWRGYIIFVVYQISSIIQFQFKHLTWCLQCGCLNSGSQLFCIVFQFHKSDFLLKMNAEKMTQVYIVTIHHLGHSCIQSKDSFHFLTSLEVCYECPTRENFSNWTERENFFILSWNFDVFLRLFAN